VWFPGALFRDTRNEPLAMTHEVVYVMACGVEQRAIDACDSSHWIREV
jgi:hypothetical protein